ncbi:MAG: FAD-dependent oxidoreductase [Planctomycetota bacterium]|nr:FAD-dependent oxidoreductase [Planctomycetota bacterium]
MGYSLDPSSASFVPLIPPMHVVVLGAGLAGLSCAYELSKAGHKVTVVEKENDVGGIGISWKKNGYWLDYGPHRFHSRNKDLINHLYEVLDNEIVIRERMSRIYMQGKFFDYPLKLGNVLVALPKTIMVKAMLDYMWIRVLQWFKPIPDTNFENWVIKRFGRTLYEIFFGTYTSKAWKMPCTEISSDWASQRISQANLWHTIKTTVFPPKEGEVRSLVSEFWYPAHGGIGTICRKYAEKIRAMGGTILLDSDVKTIHAEGDAAKSVTYTAKDGNDVLLEGEHVVNTMPLPRMLEAMDPPVTSEVTTAIGNLRYIGIVFVYLEIDTPSVSPDHWVYLPEKHLTIHRISEFKNFSDHEVPGDKTIICCEITCNRGDSDWNLTLEEGAKIAENDLITVGLIQPGISRGIEIRRTRYAYPVYDLTYRENLDVLMASARSYDLLTTTGRQGLYRYNNMDHSVAMGRKVARTIIKGVDAGAGDVAADQEYFG